MTAGHADGRCKLRQNVERSHYEDRSCEIFEISSKSVCLDLLPRDQDEHNDCPGCLHGQVRGRTPEADQTDKIGDQAGGEQSGNKRDKVSELLSHISDNKVICHLYDHLCQSLSLRNILDFQIPGKNDARDRDDRHNDPAYHKRLVDRNLTKYRDVKRECIKYSGSRYI